MGRPEAMAVIVRDQQRWALTANALKSTIASWRAVVLWLAILGAVLETLTSQLRVGPWASFALYPGITGAFAVALIPVFRQWRLGRDRLQAWIVARAASESFKCEMYLFRANAGPYAKDQPEAVISDRRDSILAKASPAELFIVEPTTVPSVPDTIDLDTYLEERAHKQVAWFRDRSTQYSRTHTKFEILEFVLTIGATVLSVLVTTAGTRSLGSWVAVITTIIGAIGTHLQAQRYSQLTISYRVTAERVESAELHWRATDGPLGKLVEACEAVLLQENEGWIAGADAIVKGSAAPPEVMAEAQPQVAAPQPNPAAR